MKKMKNKKITRLSFLTVFIFILAALISSCIKDTDGAPKLSAGNPVLISVSPTEASGGSLVTIVGSGLGDIRSVVFSLNDVPTSINSTLNTESSLLIRVPDTAYGGPQNIILTNNAGKTLEVPFNVIALPIISKVFPTEFQAGSKITITGNNLDDVSSVVIDGTTDEATIVSKTRKSMVITMPASNVDNGNLSLTNVSGTTVTSQVFVNIDKTRQVITDAYMNAFESWSWGGAYSISTDYAYTGTSSLKAAYDAGGWGGLQIGSNTPMDVTGFSTFSFWVYGANNDPSVKVQVKLNGVNDWKEFSVPSNTWTHITYDLFATWPGIAPNNTIGLIAYQLKGASQTIYFDNIVFVK
jgi:hypothetical protein